MSRPTVAFRREEPESAVRDAQRSAATGRVRVLVDMPGREVSISTAAKDLFPA